MNGPATGVQAHRGAIVHFRTAAGEGAGDGAMEHFADGVLVVRDGYVDALGPADQWLPRLGPDVAMVHHPDALLVPGFIDTHVHFAQTDIIASYGKHLLDWLQAYTYPAEARFADAGHARDVANFFIEELLANGTTTAMVFGTVHPGSVDAVMEAARLRGMRLVAGKVLMDRHCPAFLRDDEEGGIPESRALIERWHGRDRLHYAVTPRFAPTSSETQLAGAGRLLDDYPGVFLQTHLAENRRETAWVKELFPESRSYLDVYDRFGLVRERAVFAHAIHVDDTDRQRLAEARAAVAFCPSSNLFLGSGLFDVHGHCAAGVRVGMGTDVGAGTSFSMLRTLGDAYKVAKLNGRGLEVQRALYLATLGGARALDLDHRIGNFEPGKEADFIVLGYAGSRILKRRLAGANDLAEKLFALMILGDERAVRATYLMGRQIACR